MHWLCPVCGRRNVNPPAGYIAPCGRRVTHHDAPGVVYPHASQWRERLAMTQVCKTRMEIVSLTEPTEGGK